MPRTDPVRLMRRRIIIIVLLLILAGAVRGVWGVYHKEYESSLLRVEAEAQLEGVKEREMQLRADLARLKSERGIEEVLRKEYELAREGEGVLVIIDDEPEEAPPPVREKTWWEWAWGSR